MTRVVECVAPTLAEGVHVEKIVIKTRAGAARFRELARQLGRLPPVPAIFLDGELVFESTPGVEELRSALVERLRRRGADLHR